MCGIFGFWVKRKLNKKDILFGKKLTSGLQHRGPDGKNYFWDKNKGLFFGHTRLAIIDLSCEAGQPMQKHDMIISFNGEIYNYVEIRNFLEKKGYKFRTRSDTEVILSSFDFWGIEAVKKFDGMFAISLFMKNKLYLISDNFLEKPIYCFDSNDGIYFSSEPKVLVDNLNVKKSEVEIPQFLSLGFFENGFTGYKNITTIQPATIRKYTSEKKFTETKYWTVPEKSFTNGINLSNQFVDEFVDLLLVSIKRRLRSDVPMGVFLSSGLDSTIIATLIKKELKKDVIAYTVSFPEDYDESELSKKISQFLKIDHKIVNHLKKKKFEESQLLDLYSLPNDNTTAISIQLMCQSIKKNIKVALSGIGGDEITMGYNKYFFIKKYKFFFNYFNQLSFLLNNLKPVISKFDRFRKANYYFNGSESWRLIAIKNGAVLANFENFFQKAKLDLEKYKINDFLLKVSRYDLLQTLPYSYLPSIDRGSMRESIEVRSPFLSKDLFEKISMLRADQLISEQKILFKKILRRYLPNHLINTKKTGFISPVQTSTKLKNNFIKKNNLNKLCLNLKKINNQNSLRIISRINILQKFLSNNGN